MQLNLIIFYITYVDLKHALRMIIRYGLKHQRYGQHIRKRGVVSETRPSNQEKKLNKDNGLSTPKISSSYTTSQLISHKTSHYILYKILIKHQTNKINYFSKLTTFKDKERKNKMDKNKFVKEIEYENSNFTYYFLKLKKFIY